MNDSPSRARSRLARRLSWLVVLALSAAALFVPAAAPVLAASVTPVAINSGNPTCADLDGTYGGGQTWLEAKADPPGDGTLTVAGFGTITISNFEQSADGEPGSFDWSSTFGIDAVFVKAGSTKHNLYVYAPTAGSTEDTGDTELESQDGTGNGISHILFCYDASQAATPTPPVVTPTPPVVTPTPPVVTPTPPVVTPTPPVVTPTPPVVTPTPPVVTPTPPVVTPTPPVVTPTPPVVTPTPPVVTPTPPLVTPTPPVVTPTPPVVTPSPTPQPTDEVREASILIAKLDNNGTGDPSDDVLLDGASFEVWLDDGNEVFDPGQDTLVFGEADAIDGLIDTDDLLGGMYWIVETVVPNGFVGSDPILVELNLDPSVTCLWDTGGLIECTPNEGDVEDLSWTVVIVDNTPEDAPGGGVGGATGTPRVTLPATDTIDGVAPSPPAGDSWRVILLAMAGFLAAALLMTPARVVVRKDDRLR